jgi:predicted esterase
MVQQAMDALGIKKAFLTGISQGGWIATRVALYAPDKARSFPLLPQLPWGLTTQTGCRNYPSRNEHGL